MKEINLPVELINLIIGYSSSNLSNLQVEKIKKKLLEVDSLPNLLDVIRPIKSFAERNRLELQEELSEALLLTLNSLKKLSENDKEGVLRPSRLPDALQLLVLLADSHSSSTLELAHSIVWDRDHPIPPTKPPTLQEMMGDEWEEEEAREPYVSDSEPDSDDQFSSSSSISALSVEFPLTPQKSRSKALELSSTFPTFSQLMPDEMGLVNLKSSQYWKSRGSNETNQLLGLKSSQVVWKEVDVLREILGALQGRLSAGLFEEGPLGLRISKTSSPVLSHLSAPSFHSLLSSFLPSINALKTLRLFIHTLHSQSSTSTSSSPTIEAFSSALESSLHIYQKWCIDQEVILLSPRKELTISLLRLSDEVGSRFRFLDTLVHAINTLSSSSTSSALTQQQIVSVLLDFLSDSVEKAHEEGQVEMGNELRKIFEITFESIWSQIGEWITKGRLRSDSGLMASGEGEFFIKVSEDIEKDEADFLTDGFELCLTNEGGFNTIPLALRSIGQEILECGKAVHMLRSAAEEEEGRYEWPTFSRLLGSNVEVAREENPNLTNTEIVFNALFLTSIKETDTLNILPAASLGFTPFSQFVQEKIFDICQPLFTVTHFKLHRIFSQDCRLRYHLSAIQGIFLMQKGWEIGSFLSAIFDKMDQGLGSVWSDFQLLNSSWVRSIQGSNWIDAASIRFRLKPTRGSRNTSRSVKIFENLQIEYSIPSILAYIFSPQTMMIYSQIFIFLLQIRRSKHLIDRTILIKLVNSIIPAFRAPEQYIKRFYSLRRKLSWIIPVLLNFFDSFVLGQEIKNLQRVIDKSTSVKELIQGHENHVFRMRDRMLLNSTTQPIHKAILSILDLGVALSDVWTTLNSDSITLAPKSRNRNRHRSSRINSKIQEEKEEEEEDSDSSAVDSGYDHHREERTGGGGGGVSASYVSFQEQGFTTRIEQIEIELEGLVGFIRRGVEGLKSSPSASREVREIFGILSENLEGW